jgi:hypothetical protein
MNARRIIGSLLAAAVASTSMAVLATATPAAADTIVTTRVVVQVSKTIAVYGDKISVDGQVQGLTSTGQWATLPYDTGGVTLQFRANGSSVWRTLQSDSSGNSFYFYPVAVSGSGTIRVAYAGGGIADEGVTFKSSQTAKALKAQRKLTAATFSGRKTGVKGKVAPASRVKVTVFKKKGKKYKKFKVLRTKANGSFKVFLPAPRSGKFRWKVVFKGNKTFAPSIVKLTTYRY